MAVKLKMGGGDEPKKATKVRVTKLEEGKPTPEALEAANRLAKDIAIRRGLISGENTHTGGQIPKFIDQRTGKELTAADAMPPIGRFTNKVPLYVKSLEWDASSNLPYYIDEKTGDMQYVQKDLFYSPRFRMASATQPITNSIVKK